MNTHYSTIKVKQVVVKSSTYINFGVKNNDNDLKFEVDDHLRISKYENIFSKGYIPILSGEVILIKKILLRDCK